MEPLEQDKNVQSVVTFMTGNDRQDMAANLIALMLCMAKMQQQCDRLEQELKDVKAELAEIKSGQFPVKNALNKSMDALRQSVSGIKEKLDNIREAVASWAKDTAENVKLHGVSALDKAASLLHIKPALEAVQSGIQGALENVRAAVDRAEEMGFQLREAGRAMKNAARAATGKEEISAPAAQEGRFQKVVLAPVRGVKYALNAMNEQALSAVKAMEKLEQAGRDSRERLSEKKKPSIRKELDESKREAAVLALPAHEKTRKPQEAAL